MIRIVPLLLTALALSACTYDTTVDEKEPADEPGDAMFSDTSLQKSGWQQSGKLTTGNTNKAVTCQADFAPRAGYFTVQIGIDGFVGKSRNTEATIIFSVEGGQISRRITVGNGATISGPGQAVRVRVIDKTTVTPLGSDYGVQIQISPGVRPTTEQPPTLYGGFFQQGPGIVAIPIPQDAGVISVDVEAIMQNAMGAIVAPPPNVVAKLLDSAGVALKIYYIGVDATFVPVPPNAAFLEIQNFDAANTALASVIWGIDG